MSDVLFIFLRTLRIPLIVVVLVYAIATIGLTIIPGVDDQGKPWQMSLFHAFYFVSFMGSTIGFGEIPYPFTDAQRLWVLGSIYTSVIAWLYAIGHIISLVQDPTFKQALVNRSFAQSIKKLNRPFYIICGYGETGNIVNHGLSELGIQTVIIDHDQTRINYINLLDLRTQSIALNADISTPANLLSAGLNNKNCKGVIAVTQDDHINLQIAVNCKLLNKFLPVYSRSEIEDEAKNMASFGTDKIINPYEIFAKRLNLLTHSPKLHQIQNWFINQQSPEHLLDKTLPKGKWIICGYNRFGKAILDHLDRSGIELVLVDEQPEENIRLSLEGNTEGNTGQDKIPSDEETDLAYRIVKGRGTEAETLIEAGIYDANVIIAGTNDDPNNLSILITAHQLNPQIYNIARINVESNYPLFEQAHCHYAMRRCQVVANEALTLISRPLVTSFIHFSSGLSFDDRQQLIEQTLDITQGERPVTWRLEITEQLGKAFYQHLAANKKLTLGQITHSSTQSIAPCIALMLKRNSIGEILPSADTELRAGDQILFCGRKDSTILPEYMHNNEELIDTLVNKNPHHIPLLRWLWRIRNAQA